MTTLGGNDLEALQRATLELHEERELEAFQDAAPGIMLDAIPGRWFVWMENCSPGPGEPLRNLELWGNLPDFKPSVLQRLMALASEHPFTLHAMKTGDWGPQRLSDFWSTKQLLASPLYRDVYRHLDTGRLLACATFRGNRIGTINIGRPLKASDFSERDRLMLRLLAPHFEQALRAAERATARRDSEARLLPSLGLTPREVEVAVWLARGRTNLEIATILGMRSRTVEKHVEHVLNKLGVENRTAAAMLIGGTLSFGARAAPGPRGTPAPARLRAGR